MTLAAHFFRIPNALIIGIGIRSVSIAILKFCLDLWVWAPQYLSVGTKMGPKLSCYSLIKLKLKFSFVYNQNILANKDILIKKLLKFQLYKLFQFINKNET